ncbi:MAG: hypothetical protein LUF35_09565 [Lachnospiraceae bacterium]|nr:hypothetical protein [Lachnospiraceae bacterium]
MHGSPSQDRIGAVLAQKEELSGRIRSMIEAQTNLRHEIERCVGQLRSADEKAVILMRYVDNEKWADISQLLFGGKEDFLDREDSYLRRTSKIHKRALEDLAEIMKVGCPSDSRQDDP